MKGIVMEKCVLAYSGGLDTSVMIKWIKETYNCEVITVCADVGQGKELDGLNEKALATGASKNYIEDLREEFITDFVYPIKFFAIVGWVPRVVYRPRPHFTSKERC